MTKRLKWLEMLDEKGRRLKRRSVSKQDKKGNNSSSATPSIIVDEASRQQYRVRYDGCPSKSFSYAAGKALDKAGAYKMAVKRFNQLKAGRHTT